MVRERKSLSDAVMKRFMSDPNSIPVDRPSTAVPLTAIKLPVRRQPRRYFDPEKMTQLVASVREHGILEPVLVRPLEEGNYELIAGERRLRAAKEVGLNEIPIVLREFSDSEALQVALIENLQRDDLNPIEETEAVLELLAIALETSIEEVKSVIYQAANAKNRGQELKGNVSLQLKQVESCLAELGRFNLESFRSSRLPLLNLPVDVLEVLREGKLEYTKARLIARVKDESQRTTLLSNTISQNLSLSQIKEQIAQSKSNAPQSESGSPPLQEQVNEVLRLVKHSKVWSNPKKQKRLEKLLSELRALASDPI